MAKKKEITETDLIKTRQRKVLLGAGLLLISILLTISFISYFFTWQADFSTLGSLSDKAVTSKNLLNKLGAYVGYLFIYKGVGFSAILFAYLIGVTGLKLFLQWSTKKLLATWAWGLAHMLWLSIAIGYFFRDTPIFSGIVGFEINAFLIIYIGNIGIFAILFFFFLCFLVIELGWTPGMSFSRCIFHRE